MVLQETFIDLWAIIQLDGFWNPDPITVSFLTEGERKPNVLSEWLYNHSNQEHLNLFLVPITFSDLNHNRIYNHKYCICSVRCSYQHELFVSDRFKVLHSLDPRLHSQICRWLHTVSKFLRTSVDIWLFCLTWVVFTQKLTTLKKIKQVLFSSLLSSADLFY